jgi:hypothetical protein
MKTANELKQLVKENTVRSPCKTKKQICPLAAGRVGAPQRYITL